MIKRFSRLESVLASTIARALTSLFDDLPYIPCIFFFGEPEYPSEEE